jgi:hypothetical protein
VRLYYGVDQFQFISFDSSKSYYRTLKTGGGGTMTKFIEPLDFEPEMFIFRYYFIHPTFNGDTLNIEFYIDKSHRIMQGFLPEGLFDLAGQKELKGLTRQQALEVAKKAEIKEPLNRYEIELGWYELKATDEDYKSFKQSKNIKTIVKGRIVWKVTSTYRKAPEWDEKPYSETYLVDALTGEILAVEQAFTDWG